MKFTLKKLTGRFVVALLTFVIGVAVTILLASSYFRSTKTRSISEVPVVTEKTKTSENEEVSVPEGWKTLEIEGRVTLRMPPDMKPSELIGDLESHREAYANRDINITIIYGEPVSCNTPSHLLERPTYHESVINIDGRQMKIGIDHYYQPKPINVYTCFLNTDDSGMQFRALILCKDERALETAQMLLKSIKFKDTK